MKIEILCIGDELLIGQVINTNAAWIGAEVKLRGWQTVQTTVVPDTMEAILAAFEGAFSRADVVLVTGGIGPTKDDVTKYAMARYFHTDLVFNEEVYAMIERIFDRRSIKMNELTRGQAMVPRSAVVLQNEVGTAPCCWFEKDGKVLVSMPGVPSEMKWLMQHAVLPKLMQLDEEGHIILTKTFMVKDFPESALAEHLDGIEQSFVEGVSLAYLPQPGVVRLRLTLQGEQLEKLKELEELYCEQFRRALQGHIFSEEDLPISELLLRTLQACGETLASAESCTGGRIASLITEIPGSSSAFLGSVVAYANQVKAGVLGVSEQDLEQYGAVSEPVVQQMLAGVRRITGATCAIATSGVAGPGGGTEQKPVGMIWVGASYGEKQQVRCYQFSTNRTYNIERATNAGMLMLLELIQEG